MYFWLIQEHQFCRDEEKKLKKLKNFYIKKYLFNLTRNKQILVL